MVQRVGLAQALVNDPELVILDEPMSGLDPVGRREVRDIILQLRDEGRTVLFSSHILSDAELLCTRVGIVNRGKLVASGTVDELTTGAPGTSGAQGWEIVASGVSADLASRLTSRVAQIRPIAGGRYAIALAAGARPEPLIAEIAAGGASLISVAPLRTTLEDVFLRALGEGAAS
jgi:ABC-2 type transport system ATP-binding protein